MMSSVGHDQLVQLQPQPNPAALPGYDSVEQQIHMRSPLTAAARLARYRGPIFLFFVLVAFMQAGLFARRLNPHLESAGTVDLRSWSSSSSSRNTLVTEHPILRLLADAEEKFRAKLTRQSRSLKEAVKEYKRRYGRDPPKGFDAWWKFAKDHNVRLVDEYDGLMEDLEPFWSISGQELRRRALQVGYLPSIDLVRVRGGKTKIVNINNGFQDTEVSARAKGVRAMIERFEHVLPDLDFPINTKAEGRVLVPWEHREFPNSTLQDSSGGIEAMLGGPFQADWTDTGNVWDAYRRTCHPDTPARRLFSSIRNPFPSHPKQFFSPSAPTPDASSASLAELRFPRRADARYDFCHKPWAHYTQGHFFSDWRTIPALYPVFSPAKAARYSDVRVPSHYYYSPTPKYTYAWDAVNLVQKDVDDMEMPWERKQERVFWRGATTGGGSHPPGYSHQYHRHRFLRMTNDKSTEHNVTITFPAPSSGPVPTQYLSAQVPLGTLNEEIMDTAFVAAVDAYNYPGGHDAMTRELRRADAVPLGAHWAYKYLVDLDGMSYSGRFLAFLASDSAVLKATVYREYFEDWIEPWLHFIPLSSSYREIYNIHAFFSGPTRATRAAANVTATTAEREEGKPTTTAASPRETSTSTPGDRRLRRIARAGKQWTQTIGRTVDMEAYMYRLCLEYARLSADDRASMGFKM